MRNMKRWVHGKSGFDRQTNTKYGTEPEFPMFQTESEPEGLKNEIEANPNLERGTNFLISAFESKVVHSLLLRR